MKKETVEKKPVEKKAEPKKAAKPVKKAPKLPAYILRMEEESKELRSKISKAAAFVKSEQVNNDAESMHFLTLQLAAMKLYEEMLNTRLCYEMSKITAPKCDCCKK